MNMVINLGEVKITENYFKFHKNSLKLFNNRICDKRNEKSSRLIEIFKFSSRKLSKFI